jgi:hypothetical protein
MSNEQNSPTPTPTPTPTPPPSNTDIREGAAEWVAIGVGAANLVLNAYNTFKPDKAPPPADPPPPTPRTVELPPGVDLD